MNAVRMQPAVIHYNYIFYNISMMNLNRKKLYRVILLYIQLKNDTFLGFMTNNLDVLLFLI